MTAEILLIVVVGVVVLLSLRRAYLRRTIPHYSPEATQQKEKGNIIPVHQLGSRMEELAKHKDKEIICYCHSGNRSLSAAAKLKKVGFTAANLRGGISEWNS